MKIISSNLPQVSTPPADFRGDSVVLTNSSNVAGFANIAVARTWKIDSSSSSIQWTGPKFTLAHWKEITAFLRAVNATHESEACAYLFMRPGEIMAWVPPQEITGGLAANEIDTQIGRAQRALFGETEGWIPFGSVHSHCKASAFQSSTDRADETYTDGLHITLGHMDRDTFDWHARFVFDGHIYPFDAIESLFPMPDVSGLGLPLDIIRAIARHVALTAPPADTQWPKEWEENLVPRHRVSEVRLPDRKETRPGLTQGPYTPHWTNPDWTPPKDYSWGGSDGPKQQELLDPEPEKVDGDDLEAEEYPLLVEVRDSVSESSSSRTSAPLSMRYLARIIEQLDDTSGYAKDIIGTLNSGGIVWESLVDEARVFNKANKA